MNSYVNNSLQNIQNPFQQALSAQILQSQYGGKIPDVFSQNSPIALQNTGLFAQNQHSGCNLNLKEHLKYVDSLVLLKIIDKTTGESIKQNITATFNNNKAFSAYEPLNSPYNVQNTPANDVNALSEKPFDISQSEFLKARECLLNYLQNSGVELNEADLQNIEAVVLELEKQALLKGKTEAGENALEELNRTNELAKERLATSSMQGSNRYNAPKKTFSRDEIAKMSTAEFIKNEPIINYQLQNGLL